MRHPPPRISPTDGFTLVEIFVVIALIAVLAILLFSSAGKIREAGNQTKCVSQLRQAGASLLMYGSDHQQVISTGLAGTDVTTAHLWSQRLFALGYLSQKEALRCPSGGTDIVIERPGWAWQVYGLNMFGPAGKGVTSPTAPRWGYALSLKSITSPATYPLLADSATPSGSEKLQTFRITASVASGLHLRHRQRANVCFADGHVQPLDKEGLEALSIPAQIPLYQD